MVAPVSKSAIKALSRVEMHLGWPGDLATLLPLPTQVTEKAAKLYRMFRSQTCAGVGRAGEPPGLGQLLRQRGRMGGLGRG